MTGASAAIQVAWSLPLLKFQCPLSRKPPGVGTDFDPAVGGPLVTTARCSPQISRAVANGIRVDLVEKTLF